MISPSIPQASEQLNPKIIVVGVGGAGGNAVSNMIRANLQGVDFVIANTDAQAMSQSVATNKIQLGATITRGLGAGARADVGRAAAEEALEDILQSIKGSNMIFITAGMGGGTGTGAAPVIARAAREQGILTVGVVTKPFHFEGSLRMRQAEAGIEALQEHVDTLIVIPNQNLFRIANEQTTFAEAFNMADQVLHSGVRGVTDLMVMPGLINLDFNDIRSVMSEMGKAMMGTGEAEGARRAVEAAEAAISNPLLDDVSMKGARGVLINITGGMDMTLFEVDEAANRIRDEVDPDANIIFGSTFDASMNGKMRVSVVATGIDVETARRTGADSLRVVSAATSKPTLFNQQPSSAAMSAAASAPKAASLHSATAANTATTASANAPSNLLSASAMSAPSNTNATPPQAATASMGAAPRTVAQTMAQPTAAIANNSGFFAGQTAARGSQPQTAAQSQQPRTTGFGGAQASQPTTAQHYSLPPQTPQGMVQPAFSGNAALQLTPTHYAAPQPQEPQQASLSIVQPALQATPAQPPLTVEAAHAYAPSYGAENDFVAAESSPWANLRPISSSPVHEAPVTAAPTQQYKAADQNGFLFSEEDAPQAPATTQPQARKKGPSLFERVTGFTNQPRRTAEATEMTPMAPPAATSRTADTNAGLSGALPGLNLGQAPGTLSSEPQLLSQQGAKLSSTDEDLLNIPAFLRRQAN